MVKIIDGKIEYTNNEIGIMWAAPNSNISKKIKKEAKKLKLQLKNVFESD